VDEEAGPAAYLRVLAEPDGAVRVGRVCTRAWARGRGLARVLMDDVLTRHGGRPVVLDAQAHLAAFYAGLGFVACGPEFLNDGIPHVPMRRDPTEERPRSRSAGPGGR
jgi:ElaA protein